VARYLPRNDLLVRLDEPVSEVVAAAAVPWWR
jgi:hypothetical protein